MKKIGVLTSGGDAPGMNAAIRAVVRTAIYHGLEPYGIRRGYQGLVEGDIFPMQAKDVSNIIQRGGTMLKTARCEAFREEAGQQKAYEQIQKHRLEGLILIGGDGTFRGWVAFNKLFPTPAIGLPGTIDKDMGGTESTIGFDTAANTAVEAIDKIRDTAEAHDRLFIVEVMGRDAGYLALNSGIACGAEDILIPELTTNIEEVLCRIDYDERRQKTVHVIVVAEGDDFGGGSELLAKIKATNPKLDARLAVLGHIQRGGTPTCADRVLASRLGHSAVLALMEGKNQLMAGLKDNRVVLTPFEKAIKSGPPPISKDLREMIRVLAV